MFDEVGCQVECVGADHANLGRQGAVRGRHTEGEFVRL